MPTPPMLCRFLAMVLTFAGPAFAVPQAPAPAAPAEWTVVDGRVVDLRGEGVPLADICISTWKQPDVLLARGIADGEGHFRIGKVPRQDGLKVRATASGYCAGETSGSGPLTIEVHPSVTVRGVVHDRAGKPVAGAVVQARTTGRRLSGNEVLATSDPEGRFELAGVAMAPVAISTLVPGEGFAAVLVSPQDGMTVDLRHDGSPTTSITLHVDGLPAELLPTVHVALFPYHLGGLAFLPPPYRSPALRATRQVLELLPDVEYHLSLSAPGQVFTPQALKLAPSTGPHQARFTATAAAAAELDLEFRLTGPDGAPVAGVEMLVRAPNGGREARGTSDDDGKLRLASPLGPGSEAVLYSLDDRWVTAQDKSVLKRTYLDLRAHGQFEFTVAPGATHDVALVAASSVGGTLRTADGRPAAHVQLELQEQSPNRTPRWMTFAYARSSRDGSFTFRQLRHLDATLRVAVEGPLGAWVSEPFTLTGPGTHVPLGEAKLSVPAVIEGVVRDALQQPVAGVRVWLRDWDLATGNQRSGSVVETVTDAAGRYRFLGAPPGGAYLQLLPGARERFVREKATEPFEVEAGHTHTFDLMLPPR